MSEQVKSRRLRPEDVLSEEELRGGAKAEPKGSQGPSPAGEEKPKDRPAILDMILPLRELAEKFPELDPPLIEGLLRQGETCNLIAASKAGKSWLGALLAICIALGGDWLGFVVRQGKVLIVDNELKRPSIQKRLRRVSEALGVDWDAIADRIDILPLRGRLTDLHGLGAGFLALEPGKYALVIIDAWYRTLPLRIDENSNADMAQLYNSVDKFAEHLGASIVLIHHSSKGIQSGKAVTDVGSGAGSMSRATDTHLVLRNHQEEGVAVLEAAVRSWPPVKPMCLRWAYPLWTLAPELDPNLLADGRPKRKQAAGEPETGRDSWDATRMATLVEDEPRSKLAICEQACALGCKRQRAGQLLELAEESGLIHRWIVGKEHKVLFAQRAQPPPEPTPLEKFVQEHPEMDADAIAEKFGVSERHIRRIKSGMGRTFAFGSEQEG